MSPSKGMQTRSQHPDTGAVRIDYGKKPDAAPTTSWWTGLDRDQFRKAAADRQPKMTPPRGSYDRSPMGNS